MTHEMDTTRSTDLGEVPTAGDHDDERWDGWDLDPDPSEDEDGPAPQDREQRDRLVRRAVDAGVVLLCAAYVFFNLHPSQILSDAVPAGGDMGAHVWGPAFLRDNLLPELRLSGWAPDWYAGFPAYQFYMVIPSLLIVALDVGLFGGISGVLPAAAAVAATVWAARALSGWKRSAAIAAIVGAAVLAVELPYGTAFKLVTVLGLLTLPAAAYAFGRLADLRFPGPALFAVATVAFLFDRNFTIYGGNVASTLAGEFAFSISLSLAVLYLGVVIRGLRTGRHRALAAGLLALTGLSHLIPAFYALAGTGVIAVVHAFGPAVRAAGRTLRLAWEARARTFGALCRLALAPVRAAGAAARSALPSVWWLAGVLPVAGLLAAFWVLPFFWQRDYVNDMGWEKLPQAGETIWRYLIPRSPESPGDMRWVLALALMGLVLSLIFRIRAGWILAAFVLLAGIAFVVAPQGRLWNARLLPFYYLSLYMLAALGVAEVGRTLAVLAARDPERPSIVGPAATAVVGLLASLVVVGLPLRTLPFGETRADGSYSFFGLENGVDQGSFVRSWAKWNYSGYEGKDAYPEYRDVIETMAAVGEERGCGRVFWEYEKELNRYGTPMALMLLPHWTDGCMGSMEGLFFEASATTPFHFLMQVELSTAPSAAQRDLPYDGFSLDEGVAHLQLMGVRYYMATSVEATTAARQHPDLTEVASTGPWVVFEVADSELVEPLVREPAVLEGVEDAQRDWICRSKDDRGRCAGPAIRWFKDPEARDVMLASSGPESWQRVSVDDPDATGEPLAPVQVDDIEVDTDRISFSVDKPGVPVLVKTSYFPNWRVRGGDGPYRVAPNLMVVVPTQEQVELDYGREPVEWVAYALTLLGLAGLVVLARTGRRHDDDGSTPSDLHADHST